MKWDVPNEHAPDQLPQDALRINVPCGDYEVNNRERADSPCGSSLAQEDVQVCVISIKISILLKEV